MTELGWPVEPVKMRDMADEYPAMDADLLVSLN
jgi:hypothetical protein